MELKTLKLLKGKEINLSRKHPWIFSGALEAQENSFKDGDLVNLLDYKEHYVGFGHYHKGSIAVKVLGFAPEQYSSGFWKERLAIALRLRQSFFTKLANTNCFRWVHGEGDGLPGLIVDVYDQLVVIQCHSIGMHRQLNAIAHAIMELMPEEGLCLVDKSKESLPPEYAKTVENKFLKGNSGEFICNENGILFSVDPLLGQKTGFYLDQRENRNLLARYVADKKVLNVFCYTGGFSLYGLVHGASHITSIDASQRAMDHLEKNIELNQLNKEKHLSICGDAINFLKNIEENEFDLIILDPPAFAKSMNKRHQAIQAYKRINSMAMKGIASGGILFTFSCSQVVSETLFYNTVVSAGIENGRKVRVLHRLSQGPDHPVSLFHPEGTYLKGLVLHLE